MDFLTHEWMKVVDHEQTQKFMWKDFETISYRFFGPKLFYSVKVRQIESFSFSDYFSSIIIDHQEWMRKLSRSILKVFPIDFSTQNSFVERKSDQSHQFEFRTLFHQEEPIIKKAGEHYVGSFLNHFQLISRPNISS